MDNQNLIPFEGKEIRKAWHNDEWYFSVIDVISILSETTNPTSYWSKVQKTILAENELVRFWHKLKLKGQDGKARPSDCTNTEGVFRIVMSVPSPKAEPLKLWLAEQGKRTIDEAENPELLTERQAELYRAKGYSEEWITRRVQTIETRKALTDEWQKRGVKENQEYAILTATIAKGTFGVTPTEHKEIKGLARQNLRDHMTPLELIFTALAEEVTKQVTIDDEAQGFNESHDAAAKGGRLAGEARERLESQLKKPIVSTENYLNLARGDNKQIPTDQQKDPSV